MALLERLEIVIEADARTAEREFDRIGRQATESLESIETAAADVGDNASKKLAGAAPEFARAGERLSDAAGKELDLSAAAERAAADLPRAVEGQRGEMAQAGRRAGDAAGGGVADGVRDASGRVRGAGDALGSDVGDGVSGGILESLGGLGGDLSGALDDALGSLPAGLAGPAAAVGAAVGAGIIAGVADAIETESLGDLVAARVGEGVAKSEEFARVTSDVFAQAWGESKAEVADAVDAVYSTLEDSQGSEEALADLTKRAQAFADVFDQDVGQAVSNAGILIETGLARDAVDAFDLMTAAAQRVPAAMRDELGEATQEYSTFFGALGFEGREAFSILTDAAQEGRYELDKTGDAIKELSIRATDLNDVAAMDALEQLGLDAEDTANKLLAGGEAARTATDQIITALDGVEDPAEQAALAVDLMGAPLEDLNKQEIPEFIDRLANATGGMRDAAGASDELTNSLDNAAVTWTELRREFQNGLGEAAGGLFDLPLSLAGGEQGFGDIGEAAANAFVEGFELLPVGRLTDALSSIMSSVFDGVPFGDFITEGVLEGLPDPLSLTVGVALGGEAVEDDNSFLWDAIDNGGKGEIDVDVNVGANSFLWDNLEQPLEDVAEDAERARVGLSDMNREIELSNDLFGLAAERADNYLSRIADSSSFDDFLSTQLDLNDALGDIGDAFVQLRGIDIEDIMSGAIIPSGEVADGLRDIMAAGDAAQQSIATALEFGGAEAATAKADQVRSMIVDMADAAGLSDEQVNDLLESMGLLPEQVTTAIELSGADEALAKLDLLSARYEESIPSEVQTQIDLAIAEGRFVDAANLLSIWVQDQEDGFIDNPLLVAMGLGDTGPASGEVDDWKDDEESKPPAELPVGADTSAARDEVSAFQRWLDASSFAIDIVVPDWLPDWIPGAGGGSGKGGGNSSRPKGRPPGNGGVGWVTGEPIDPGTLGGKPGRALGGPMLEGATYEVNERGQELFVSNDGGFMVNASNLKQLMDNLERVATGGGSGMQVVQNITAPGPMEAASESARKLRDASYLVGV